ncbi:hypothetical protein BJY00DRAFT_308099 [Aspergillus carlsbadensis]|nr:hypothetical protein BJY00DRAFT_308099 [Aspergillus carlsbadensis]
MHLRKLRHALQRMYPSRHPVQLPNVAGASNGGQAAEMEPNTDALEATRVFASWVQAAEEYHYQTNDTLRELQNLNYNIFRMLNELREAASKPALDLGYLEDYSDAWDEAEAMHDE